MASNRPDVIEHNVEDQYILEKAHVYHTKRLLDKRFTSIEKKIKDRVYSHFAQSEEGLSVGDSRKLGVFSIKIQEQRRDSMEKTKKLCYELGLNPEMYKSTRKIEAVGPTHDNGLFTYVQYEQQAAYLRKKNPDFKEMDDAIKEVLNKEDPSIQELEFALEIVWSFRKTLDDELKEDKEFFKQAISEYQEKPGGFAPQEDTYYLHMNNNISYGRYEQHIFEPKKFLSHLEDMSNNEEHPLRNVIINKGYEAMEKDIHASVSNYLIMNHLDKLDQEMKMEITEIKRSDAPENVYEYALNNIDDQDVIDDVNKFVQSSKETMVDEDPVKYLLQSVKQTSLIVKIDPARGFKSPEAQRKNALLADAKEAISELLEYAKGAKTISLEDIYLDYEKAEQEGNRFDVQKLIAKGALINSPDYEKIKLEEESKKKTIKPNITLDM